MAHTSYQPGEVISSVYLLAIDPDVKFARFCCWRALPGGTFSEPGGCVARGRQYGERSYICDS